MILRLNYVNENMSDKIDLVLDVTRELILEMGMDAISMNKIARQAKVPVGNLYYWFENKTDLINKTYIRSRNKLVPEVRVVDKTDIIKGLKDYLMLYIQNAIDNHKDHMLVENLYLSPIINQENKMSADVYFGDIKMSDLVEMGILKRVDPELLGIAVVGIVNKVVILKIINDKCMTQQEKEQLLLICWDAVKA